MVDSRSTKRHINLMSVIVLVPCLLLVTGNTVFAEPYLQLDAYPSTYLSSPDEESIFTTDTEFTLYALVNSDSGNIQGDGDGGTDGPFYLSFAIVPKVTAAADLGSIVIDGTTVSVTGDMVFGAPPADAFINPDEIPGHGIFDTFYYEHEFELDSSMTTDLYNSQDEPGRGPIDPDGPLWYQDFAVDVSGLTSGYVIHIDLYTKLSDGTIEYFAPFSHDIITTPVPGAVLLGMIGLGVAGVKLRKYA